METDNTRGYSAKQYTILAKARELNQDASIVLPLLNIKIQPYTEFIINKVLIRKFDSIENIIEELNYVNNHEILDLIRLSVRENYVDYQTIYDSLEGKREIKYLNEFITFMADILDDDLYL